jgi:hypothetical protein
MAGRSAPCCIRYRMTSANEPYMFCRASAAKQQRMRERQAHA